ncbi:MAG: hypothetical protein JKX76_00945 [Colwellia sp.]|nr:hypothetical protein [Colwellia sp.]
MTLNLSRFNVHGICLFNDRGFVIVDGRLTTNDNFDGVTTGMMPTCTFKGYHESYGEVVLISEDDHAYWLKNGEETDECETLANNATVVQSWSSGNVTVLLDSTDLLTVFNGYDEGTITTLQVPDDLITSIEHIFVGDKYQSSWFIIGDYLIEERAEKIVKIFENQTTEEKLEWLYSKGLTNNDNYDSLYNLIDNAISEGKQLGFPKSTEIIPQVQFCICNGTGVRPSLSAIQPSICECSFVATSRQAKYNRNLLFISESSGSIIQTIQDNIASFLCEVSYRKYDYTRVVFESNSFENMFIHYGNLDNIKNYIKLLADTPISSKAIVRHVYHNQFIGCHPQIIIKGIVSSEMADNALKNGFLDCLEWCMDYGIFPQFHDVFNMLLVLCPLPGLGNKTISKQLHYFKTIKIPRNVLLGDLTKLTNLYKIVRSDYTLLNLACKIGHSELALELITRDVLHQEHSVRAFKNSIINCSEEVQNKIIETYRFESISDIFTFACSYAKEDLAINIFLKYINTFYLSHEDVQIVQHYIFLFNMVKLNVILHDNERHFENWGVTKFLRQIIDFSNLDLTNKIQTTTSLETRVTARINRYGAKPVLTHKNIKRYLTMVGEKTNGSKRDCLDRLIQHKIREVILMCFPEPDQVAHSAEAGASMNSEPVYTQESLKAKTIPLLKNILREKKLLLGGNKQILIDRILAI